MRKTATDTLLKFLNLNPEFTEQSKRIAFFRAQYHLDLKTFQGKEIDYFQTFRPQALNLVRNNYKISENLKQQYDLVLYLPTRFREENLFNMSRAFQLLPQGGYLICSLENELGAESLRDRLKQLAGNVESYSKNHCRVFYAKKEAEYNSELALEYLNLGYAKKVGDTDLLAKPGVFSWNKTDQGSVVLAENFVNLLSGKGADLGAGYGFLTQQALASNPKITSVDLYDAELNALNLAKENLKDYKIPIKYFKQRTKFTT